MAARRNKYGLLLAPGAGSASDSPQLLAIEGAAPQGFVVRRIDFPYRLAGRKAPDRLPVLLSAVSDAVAAFSADSGIPASRIFVGGRSMGGRICSIAVADGLQAAGCVLVSYPLHPPGKPDKLRVDHFPAIEVPCLFVSGTRDAFGTPAELEHHTASIGGQVDHVWLEGHDHSLKRHDDAVAAAVSTWLAKLQTDFVGELGELPATTEVRPSICRSNYLWCQ